MNFERDSRDTKRMHQNEKKFVTFCNAISNKDAICRAAHSDHKIETCFKFFVVCRLQVVSILVDTFKADFWLMSSDINLAHFNVLNFNFVSFLHRLFKWCRFADQSQERWRKCGDCLINHVVFFQRKHTLKLLIPDKLSSRALSCTICWFVPSPLVKALWYIYSLYFILHESTKNVWHKIH